jgi:hypothetical protein
MSIARTARRSPVRNILALATFVILAGCAGPTGEPDPAPAPEITGTYTLSTTIQGSPVEGRMRITGEPGDYGGYVYTDFTGELPISRVEVDGTAASLTVETPDGPASVRLDFAGDSFTGEWAAGGDGGTIRGRRVEG